ncbi:MAG: trypsin-like serine protease, partial [Hymenobacter sp.]
SYPLYTLLFLLFFSGIIRHDVKESKYVKLGQQRQFNCVSQVFLGSTPNASAVLISENFALSAAHIFIDSDTRMDTVKINGKRVILSTSINERVIDFNKLSILHNGKYIKVKSLVIHPNYLNTSTKGSCDIALLELEEPIKDVLFPKINNTFDELNSKVVGVGYGASGMADKPETVKRKYTKIAGENVIDLVAGAEYGQHQTVLNFDFDHPTRKDCNKMGSANPLRLEYTAGGGDSGGGLFRKKGNTWELVGIASSGSINIEQFKKTGYYGQTMSWTRVAAFHDWVLNQLK